MIKKNSAEYAQYTVIDYREPKAGDHFINSVNGNIVVASEAPLLNVPLHGRKRQIVEREGYYQLRITKQQLRYLNEGTPGMQNIANTAEFKPYAV